MNNGINIQDLENIHSLCKSRKVFISFTFSGKGSEVCCVSRKIYIDLTEVLSLDWLYSLTFHELAHIECYDSKKYYIYHHEPLTKVEMFSYMKKMALRVERFVDKLGEFNMKKEFPDKIYMRSYESKEDIRFLRDWIDLEYGAN